MNVNVEEDATLKLLNELLKIPSVTPHDMGCQERIIERLEPLGFHPERINFNETNNLFARWGKKKPLICFAGHTDVVPAGNPALWQSPPFAPTLRDGKIYARGAADMKSGLAAFITAMERVVKEHPDFPGSLAVLITSDEEGDNRDGTKKVVDLLAQREEEIDYCIVAEPTSARLLGDTIKNGRRGSLSGKVKIKGKQGHIAYPELAKNPIHQVVAAMGELLEHEWDKKIPYFPRTGLQFSNIHSGLGVGNVIPGELELWFNFRYSPANTAAELEKKVEAILRRHDLDFEVTWDASGEPFITPEGKLTQVATEAVRIETGRDPELNTTGGTSDGRFIKKIARELIELGPVNASIHQIDEHVAVDDVVTLTRIYEKIMLFLGAEDHS